MKAYEITDDRELLELAAKAAGIPLKPDFAERYDYYMADRLMWNPLTNDGDALRLAVKLNLAVVVNETVDKNETKIWIGHTGCWLIEPHNNDPYSATRRAIVRAAAEIGKELKCIRKNDAAKELN